MATCQVVGRLKDMIIRGGENIYPREIEEFLFTHPRIQDAKVVGIPDEKYGEEVCVWVKLKEGELISEDEIRAFCKDHIAYFKVPRYIRMVDELSDDGHGQGAEVQNAGADGKRTRAGLKGLQSVTRPRKLRHAESATPGILAASSACWSCSAYCDPILPPRR